MTPAVRNARPVHHYLTSRAGASLLLALAWALVYLPALGRHGLHSTEGHRAIPGWTMLDSGQWLRLVMFEQPYLRKPPGMPWAVGACSAWLGDSAFSARLASALATLAGGAIVLLLTRAWVGRTPALAAGLLYVLLPAHWLIGRAAEIEALNSMFTTLACLALLRLALPAPPQRARARRHEFTLMALATLGLVGMIFAKGPAGAPAVAGTLVGALVAARWLRRQTPPNQTSAPDPSPPVGPWSWRVLAPLALGPLLAGPVGYLVLTNSGTSDAVYENPSQFFWQPGKALEVLAAGPIAWVSLLPASLALLLPFGPDARREVGPVGLSPASTDPDLRQPALVRAVGLALATGWLAAAALWTLLGIDNPRYYLPAAGLLCAAWGYLAWGAMQTPRASASDHSEPPQAPGMMPHRARIARWMALGAWWSMPAILLAAGIAYWSAIEPRTLPESGEAAGDRARALLLADLESLRRDRPRGRLDLPNSAVVLADGMIEARPEVLWRLAHPPAKTVAEPQAFRIVWVPGLARHHDPADRLIPLPDEAVRYVLLRRDDLGDEVAALAQPLAELGAHEVGTVRVHKFTGVLYRIEAPRDDSKLGG